MTELEFWRSTPRKIGTLWRLHTRFNGWEIKDKDNEKSNGQVYKKMNIEDIPFL